MFQGEATIRGERRTVRLFYASDVRIKRHVKVRGQANPYDPAWELYFERRLDVRMTHSLADRRHLLFLWQRQKGFCPHCRQKITPETGWHSHHVIWKVHGGSDAAENRVLLHPNCHRQIHQAENFEEEPRPE